MTWRERDWVEDNGDATWRRKKEVALRQRGQNVRLESVAYVRQVRLRYQAGMTWIHEKITNTKERNDLDTKERVLDLPSPAN